MKNKRKSAIYKTIKKVAKIFYMKKIFSRLILSVLFFVLLNLIGQYEISAMPLSGSIEKEHYIQFDKTSTVIDISTGKPITNANISIPSKGINTKTDENGKFNLNLNLNAPVILSINAEGYNPFSLTITDSKTKEPLVIGISKKSGKEIVIDSNLRHLGDNIFSDESANAKDFQISSSGSFFHKEFLVDNLEKNNEMVLKIGSIIGIDTEIARKLNQGSTKNGISTPTKVYINSQKVGEIKINGDDQQIFVPVQLLKTNVYNQIVIETGKNIYSQKRVDYDDIEFMNIILEFR